MIRLTVVLAVLHALEGLETRGVEKAKRLSRSHGGSHFKISQGQKHQVDLEREKGESMGVKMVEGRCGGVETFVYIYRRGDWGEAAVGSAADTTWNQSLGWVATIVWEAAQVVGGTGCANVKRVWEVYGTARGHNKRRWSSQQRHKDDQEEKRRRPES
jgi:hypothetical protein